MLHVNPSRSHRLNPGIASFSVITGSKITISRNQLANPKTHRNVDCKVGLFGGFGKGFDSTLLPVPRLNLDPGTGGSGLDILSRADVTAARRSCVVEGVFEAYGFGGTGGPS